jgi:hypothetical protein
MTVLVIVLLVTLVGTSACMSKTPVASVNTSTPVQSVSNHSSSLQAVSHTSQTQSVTPVTTVTQTQTTAPVSTKIYAPGSVPRSFQYVLRGQPGFVTVNLNSNEYASLFSTNFPPTCVRYTNNPSLCTTTEVQQYYLNFINEPSQKKYLDSLVSSIQSITPNKDDQVRIAISLVQQIPYDYTRLNSKSFKMRTPYEVLYENEGVCSEKSVLLAYLARGLGYGVVLFEFPSQNHMAVGIKSSSQYAFRNTGYAFVETTEPTIPTDDQESYVGAGKLTSAANVLFVSDGSSFLSISQEYSDAQEFDSLMSMGRVLDPYHYSQWKSLVQKYGLKISNH